MDNLYAVKQIIEKSTEHNLKVTSDKVSNSDTSLPNVSPITLPMDSLKVPAGHQPTVAVVLQNADLTLETKLDMLRTMKLEDSVIFEAADHPCPDFRLLLSESRRQSVNFILKQEDWPLLKTVISIESNEFQEVYASFLEKVARVSAWV